LMNKIVNVETAKGVVTARQGPARELGGRFAQPPADVAVDPLGRLGQDGAVRMPPAVIARAGLRPGDFVYFQDTADGIRILTGAQIDEALTTHAEP